MKQPPSPKQKETLEHIRAFLIDKGYSPTIADLSIKAGVNLNAMQDRLKGLESKGHIKRDPKVARSIRLS